MMKEQLQAKIFLADERGCVESEFFRTQHTFNFRENFKLHKNGFHGMYLLNEETIAGGKSINATIEKKSCVLLLPLVGTVLCKINNQVKAIVNPGQLQVFTLPSQTQVEFLNCYENDLINFIQVWIHADSFIQNVADELHTFAANTYKNKLLHTNAKAMRGEEPLVSIGKFMGRNEDVYKMKSRQSSLFIFVIDGAFEVQGRLLHARDGLGIWNHVGEVELEALSNEALILFIEMNE